MIGTLGAPRLQVPALGLAVAALWGAADFFGGLATRKARAIFVVAVSHTVSVAGICLAGLIFHARVPDDRAIFWAVVSGLVGGAALMVFYRALADGEMGLTAAVTGVLTAVVPVAFSWATLGRPEFIRILGFVIAAVAIYLIAANPGRVRIGHGARPLALGLAVIAGLGFGAFLVTAKLAGQGAALWPLAYIRLMSAGLAWALLLGISARRRSSGAWCEPGQLHRVILLAVVAGAVEISGNFLYLLTTRIGRLDVAAVLSSLYPAFTILLAIRILHERVTRKKAWGLILALAAVVAISI